MKKERASFPFLCTCGSNTRLKFQIETRKIETRKIETERGIAVMLRVLIGSTKYFGVLNTAVPGIS